MTSPTASASCSSAVAGEKSMGPPKSVPIVTPTPGKLENPAVTLAHRTTTELPSVPPTMPSKSKSSNVLSRSSGLLEKDAKPAGICGYHEEIDRKSCSTTKSRKATRPKGSANKYKKKTPLKGKFPLLSRYCGCCGDLISMKAYGYDRNHDCDRRFVHHPEEQILPTQSELVQGAEVVKQRLLSKASAKSNKTATTRTKKKKSKTASTGDQDFLKALEPWPEEAIRMDATILEGLLSLKRTPLYEMNCMCWREPSPGTKKDSTMPSAKKKPKVAKANKTTAKKKLKPASGTPSKTLTPEKEIISTKVVITKCPKTGKKIKKTVRVIKKKVKKLLGPDGQLVAPSKGTTAVKDGTSKPPTASSPSETVYKTSSRKKLSLPFADKENKGTPDNTTASTTKNLGSTGKKRNRDTALSPADEDPEDDPSDDDGSDDDGDISFNGPGISLKKRRRNDEKADLELRDRLMNCPLEGGPILPSEEELMELTTIRKRNALQTFYKRFNELRQFIVIFGDANVPQQFPENHSLGIWVNKMRMERKKWDTGSERTSLTERKIELLESIDFIWAQNHKGEIGWERRFQEIRKFKRKHGHCNVPTKSAENRALGRWVSTQRTMYKNYMKGFVGKSLTREEQERRIFLLLKEGFLFSMIPSGHNSNGTGSGESSSSGGNGGSAMNAQDAQDSAAAIAAAAEEERNAFLSKMSKSSAATQAMTASIASKAVHTTISPKSTSSGPTGKIEASKPEKSSIRAMDTTMNEKHQSENNEPTKAVPAKTVDDCEEKKDESGDQRGDNNKGIAPNPSPKASNPEPTATLEKTAEPTSPNESKTIAQVSVSTTPSTTPSVSRTASPLRSPDKAIPDQKETDDATKPVVEDDNRSIVGNDKNNHAIKIEETTVADKGKTENVSTPESKEIEVDHLPVTTIETEVDATVNGSAKKIDCNDDQTKQVSEIQNDPVRPSDIEESAMPKSRESTPSQNRTRIRASARQSSPVLKPDRTTNSTGNEIISSPSPTSSSLFVRSATSPAVLRVTETESITTVSIRLKDKPTLKINRNATRASPIDSTPPPTNGHHPQDHLVTNNGMRIIIKMDDPEIEDFLQTKDSGAFNARTTPSPNRRSGRARKKSARQLEAEKGPLRESIIGR